MPTESLVSVILIFLDEEKFIQEAIDSVFAQNYENWELFLVDDGSTDGSTEIARRCAGQHPEQVHYLEHQGRANQGMSASRNLAVRQVRGRYVAFLDADDVWLPDKLEIQVPILERHASVSMVFGPTEYWYSWTGNSEDEGRDFVPSSPLHCDIIVPPPRLLVECAPLGDLPTSTTCGFLIRREKLQEVGGFVDAFRGLFEDQAFLAKVFSQQAVFVSQHCTARYRMHPDSCVSRSLASAEYHEALGTYLRWLREYLRKEGCRDAAVWRSVRHAEWPFRHRVLHRTQNKGRKLARRASRIGRSVARLWNRLQRGVRGKSRGWIQADPNPIEPTECRLGVGATTISWESRGAEVVEIRVGSPDGPLFSRAGTSGAKRTGKWVGGETVFFLQDVSHGAAAQTNTLDSVTVSVFPNEVEPKLPLLVTGTSGNRGRPEALVLLYHRIADELADPWSLCVTPKHFKQHLEVLRSTTRLLPLQKLPKVFREGKLTDRFVAVTFDDGYLDILSNAKPFLERYEVPATVFLITAALRDGDTFWWDELGKLLLCRESLPDSFAISIDGRNYRWDSSHVDDDYVWGNPLRGLSGRRPKLDPRLALYRSLHRALQEAREPERRRVLDELSARTETGIGEITQRSLNVQEVIALAEGGLVEVGSHTVNHALLPALTLEEQHAEVEGSKAYLEEIIGRKVSLFSYPYGSFTEETVSIVRKSGFRFGCTTNEARVGIDSDMLRLPRFTVKDWDGEEFSRRLWNWLERSDASQLGRKESMAG